MATFFMTIQLDHGHIRWSIRKPGDGLMLIPTIFIFERDRLNLPFSYPYMSGGHLPPAPSAVYTEILP
jgi:hypothetical protein